jgi:hypothetical protein
MWQVDPGQVDAMLKSSALLPAVVAAGSSPFEGITLRGGVEPIFRVPARRLRARLAALPAALRADPVQDLAGYYHAFTETEGAAKLLCERLGNEPGVTYAAVQGRPEVPLLRGPARARLLVSTAKEDLAAQPAALPDYEPLQRYLQAAPEGIDARHAWTFAGGRGRGVRIMDVENGWNFSHEDLRENQVGVIHGANVNEDHGTAVLGVFSGDKNGFGVTGIAADAVVGASSAVYSDDKEKWDAADAIRAAAERLKPGDVILLEMHAPGPHYIGVGQEGFIPVEYWQPEFAAIRDAVSRGIHVVEAAGNGGEDLDHPDYKGAFNRVTRDSGAILVGGGASAHGETPRARLSWSNYGTRVDVQGWGEDIVTTGGRSDPRYYDLRDDPDPARCYTQSFNGTSGASPIIVGAVACLSGVLAAAHRSSLSPAAMRRLLVQTGTPQADGPTAPASQHIGPLPDLRRAIAMALAAGGGQ